MTETKSNVATYLRLQIAYFLQFAIWGSYGFALFGFASGVLKWTGSAVGLLGAAVPLGAFIGPLVFAPIADRYFPAQKILAVLHFICGILLCLAGYVAVNTPGMTAPLIGLMFVVGVFYMPTIALLNSVVFKHVPDSNNAPYVFVFGTAGWILVVLFIQAFFGAGETNGFFYVGAGCCFLLALYSLTLPNTPPQGAGSGDGDVLGLKAFSLLKEPSFMFFVIASLLAGIAACGFFFTISVTMLSQRGFPAPLALTTINQFSELFFMAALPFCAARFGLKKVLLIGIGAWLLRYGFWMSDAFSFALLGLLLHGMCYSFLYNASYMYGDKVSPPEMKASVQGMMAFLLLGVGQVLGALLAGYLTDVYPAPLAKSQTQIALQSEEDYMKALATAPAETPEAATSEKTEASLPLPVQDGSDIFHGDVLPDVLPISGGLPSLSMSGRMLAEVAPAPASDTTATESSSATASVNEMTKEQKEKLSAWKKNLPSWNDKDQDDSAWKYLDLKTTLLGEGEKKEKPAGSIPDGKHLGIDLDTNNDKVITYDEIMTFPAEGRVYNGFIFTRKTLLMIFQDVYAVTHNIEPSAVIDTDIQVTRAEYLKAQSYGWDRIFMVPMALCAVAFVLLLLFGKDPKTHEMTLAEEAAPVGAGEGVVVPEEKV